MMSKSRQRSPLVQKLITSYFSRGMQPRLLSLSTELDSILCTKYSQTSDSCYVSETPVSKPGNPDYYLGKCNTVSEETPRRAIFVTTASLNSYSSFEYMPSLSDVNFSIGSPITSSESVAFRR
jgi:hypothetical protein